MQSSKTTALDLEAFAATPLQHEPFDYLILPGFLRPQALPAIHEDYPSVPKSGSFPVGEVKYGPAFAALVEELKGPEMRAAFEKKFDMDLTGRPVTLTVRGLCSERDGRIHTDSKTKLITVLIYMNPKWEESGGRLRLLRSASDIEDFFAEVPPEEGTMIAFRRSDNSYHGHKQFVGPRRVIQLNWVTDEGVAKRKETKHRLSALLKKVLPGGKSPSTEEGY